MRNITLALIALPAAALALGFGAGYLVGRPLAARADTDADVERTEAPARPPSNSAELAMPVPPSGARAAREGSDPASSTEATAVARHARGASGLESGDGVLRGRVVDADGRAVTDATVTLTRRVSFRTRLAADTSSVGLGWPGFDEIEALSRQMALSSVESRSGSVAVHVDAEGRFEATGLPEHPLVARTYADGLIGERRIVRAGQTVDLVMRPVARFHLEPRLPSGEIPETATVIQDPTRRRARAYRWTRADPVVRLESPTATLQVLAGDAHRAREGGFRSSFRSEQRLVDLESDGDGPHVFDLEPANLLLVDLRVPGLALDGLGAWVELRGPTETSGPRSEPRRMDRSMDGPFLAEGLAPGTYAVAAGRDGGRSLVEATVEIVEPETTLTLQLPPVERRDFLVARCVDEDGGNVADVSFWIESERRTGALPSILRPGGEHWFTKAALRALDILDGETFVLEARCASLGRTQRTIASGQSEVVFTFTPPADVVVLVEGATADRALGVILVPSSVRDRLRRGEDSVQLVPANGRVAYGRVQSGAYTLILGEVQFGRWIDEPLVQQRVDLAPGERTLRVSVPALSEVVVTVPGAKRGESVQLEHEELDLAGRRQRSAKIDADGTARFAEVPPGSYRVSVPALEPTGEMLVDVPCGAVRFEASPVTGQVVRSVRDGAGARAGLEVGDVIVGPGLVTWSQSLRYDLLRRLENGPVTLQIERRGVPRSITLEPPTEDVKVELGLTLRSRLAR